MSVPLRSTLMPSLYVRKKKEKNIKTFAGILGFISGVVGTIAALAGSRADVSILEQRYALLFGLILCVAGFSAVALVLFSRSKRKTYYSIGSLVVAALAFIGLLTRGP